VAAKLFIGRLRQGYRRPVCVRARAVPTVPSA
jgi:hypothetical protein